MDSDTSTLYARLGGSEAIQAVTKEFYRLVLDDPLLALHFNGVDMVKQQGMLAAFLSMASGGPDGYSGRDLRAAHAGLAIGDREFDAVVAHLASVLAGAGVGADVIAEVAGVAETVRGDVLGS